MTETSYYIGVDLGRSTRIALVSDDGIIHRRERVMTETKSGRALVNGVMQAVARVRETSAQAVKGVGVGLPGLVNFKTQQFEVLTNFVNVNTIDMHGELEKALGIPVVFDNDANMAAYAEWRCGAARGLDDVATIMLGRGIGSALILGGRLQRGARGFAGELGHVKMGTDGLECSCGSAGCLETVASGPNIVRRTRERLFTNPDYTKSKLIPKMKGRLTCEDVVEAASRDDELAKVVLAETAVYLGTAIADVVNLLNVEMVVLGGPVMAAGDFLLGSIKEEVSRRAFAPLLAGCSIVQAKLGDDAGVIGAALSARDFGRQPT